MENQQDASLTGSLSQYFADDPPSYFDKFSNKDNTGGLLLSTFDEDLKPVDFQNPEDDLDVSDEVRNFWIPPHTEPGIPPHLTTPGVLSSTDIADPVQDAVKLHLGETELSKRKMYTADDVTQDERGLRQLIASGYYGSAVNLTSRLLTIYGQGYGRAGQPAKHTPHSLQLWFTRLSLLAKLKQFELLQSEAEPFGILNRPDVYYEFYPEMYSDKKGSIASFSFRLLLSEIPMYNGNMKLSMDRLTQLLTICNEIKSYFKDEIKNYEYWRKRELRILYSIINCSILIKDYNLIDDIMQIILNQFNINKNDKRLLYSSWGRIYIQIGDIFGAEQKFSESRRLKENSNTPPDLRDLIDKGLLSIAQNNFQEAYLNFQKALQFDTSNIMLLNNMGVCLLYCGKLKDAINLFEKAMKIDPKKFINENLIINLSTLYELESNNARIKKLNLLKIIYRYKTDSIIDPDHSLKLHCGN